MFIHSISIFIKLRVEKHWYDGKDTSFCTVYDESIQMMCMKMYINVKWAEDYVDLWHLNFNQMFWGSLCADLEDNNLIENLKYIIWPIWKDLIWTTQIKTLHELATFFLKRPPTIGKTHKYLITNNCILINTHVCFNQFSN